MKFGGGGGYPNTSLVLVEHGYNTIHVFLAYLRPFHLMTLTPNLYGLRNYLDLILRFDTTLALASVPEVNWGGAGNCPGKKL